jgi:hypothetical protein
MKKTILTIVGAIAAAAGLLGAVDSVSASPTAVPIPATFGVYGPTVQDNSVFFPGSMVRADAAIQHARDRVRLNVTSNRDGYWSHVHLVCNNTLPSGETADNFFGTNASDGDLNIVCQNGGVYVSADGAVWSRAFN